MAAKGYTTESLVESELGQSLTAEQATYLATLIEQAEHEIDAYTGRSWLTGALTDEAYWQGRDFRRQSCDLYLRHWPVSSVAAVKVRTDLGQTEETLTADVDYELRDGGTGWLRFEARLCYDRIRVSYTPTDAAALASPDGLLVQRAATLLVADWIRPVIEPGTAGIQSYSIGSDLSVTYRPGGAAGRIVPPAARDILDMLRVPRV